MKLNLDSPIDRQKFKEYSHKLWEERSIVEIKKINKNRTMAQNSYLHLILGWFAVEYGETIDYVKEEIFKKHVNKDIFQAKFTNRKTGESRLDWRSSTMLDTAEMAQAIERFRTWSSKEANIYLPAHNERDYLADIEIRMDRVKEYL